MATNSPRGRGVVTKTRPCYIGEVRSLDKEEDSSMVKTTRAWHISDLRFSKTCFDIMCIILF